MARLVAVAVRATARGVRCGQLHEASVCSRTQEVQAVRAKGGVSEFLVRRAPVVALIRSDQKRWRRSMTTMSAGADPFICDAQ